MLLIMLYGQVFQKSSLSFEYARFLHEDFERRSWANDVPRCFWRRNHVTTP